MNNFKVDWKAAEYTDEGRTEYPVFSGGLYVCEIIDAVHKPDNQYQGAPKPCYTMHLKPLKNVLDDDKMIGTDDKEIKNWYINADGEEREKYIFLNISLPLTLHPKSWFSKLTNAVFKNTAEANKKINCLEDFIGYKVVANLIVHMKEDGTKVNKIESLSYYKGNNDKSAAQQIEEITVDDAFSDEEVVETPTFNKKRISK